MKWAITEGEMLSLPAILFLKLPIFLYYSKSSLFHIESNFESYIMGLYVCIYLLPCLESFYKYFRAETL